MKCTETRKVLSRYLDHELSSREAASVEEHLGRCPACRSEHAAQRDLWILLARVEPLPSPDLRAAIEARLARPRRLAASWSGLRLASLGYAAAAAAVVGLFVGAGVWAGNERAAAQVTEHDRAFGELLSDAPPGMEAVAELDRIGERP